MPAFPLIPTFVKVAVPLVVVTLAVPTTVAPTEAVIVTVLLAVMRLPPLSLIVTTGCVVNTSPLTDPAAEVVSVSALAGPSLAVIDCVADVSVPAEGAVANVRVYEVPLTPLIPAVVKVATPEDADTVAVPTTVPPALTVIVTCCVELPTLVPAASWICTTGCVVKADPLAAVAALVVSTNCVAALYAVTAALAVDAVPAPNTFDAVTAKV